MGALKSEPVFSDRVEPALQPSVVADLLRCLRILSAYAAVGRPVSRQSEVLVVYPNDV